MAEMTSKGRIPHAPLSASSGIPSGNCGACGRVISRYNNGDYCTACSTRTTAGETGPTRDTRDDIGVRLHVWRRRRGMTLEVLGGLCGLTPAYLSMIENGKRTLDRYSRISAIAWALGVPPAELAPNMSAVPSTGKSGTSGPPGSAG